MSDLQATSLDGSRTVIERKNVEIFAASLRGALLKPGQPGYDEGRVLWNGMMDKRPALIVYTGDPAVGETLLRPVRNWAKPLVDLSGPLPWTVLQSMFDPFVPKQAQRYYWKNLYINRNDDEVLDRLIEIAATTPSRYTYLVWQPLGGAMARVGDEETAFGPRKVGTMWEFDSMWVDPAEDEKNIAWTRKGWADLQRYSNGGSTSTSPGSARRASNCCGPPSATPTTNGLPRSRQSTIPRTCSGRTRTSSRRCPSAGGSTA